MEVTQGLLPLGLGHQARARWVFGHLFVDSDLLLVIFSFFLILVQVAGDLAIVLVLTSNGLFICSFRSGWLESKDRLIRVILHKVLRLTRIELGSFIRTRYILFGRLCRSHLPLTTLGGKDGSAGILCCSILDTIGSL